MSETRSEETVHPAEPTRRTVLSLLWTGLGIAALIELIWVVGAFLRPGRRAGNGTRPQMLIEAGTVENFSPGSVTAFPRGAFYLARLADGGFLALSRRCPHLGCTLPWVEAEKRFVCPCHASAFDIRGDVIHSPAPRGMDFHPVTIENNVVKVDAGRVVKRNDRQTVQAIYPQRT